MSLLNEAVNGAISRRTVLKGVGASLAAAPLLGGLTGCDVGSSSPARAATNYRTKIVLLGTMGGLSWWPCSDRTSSSSAIVVNGSIYLIDVGQNSTFRLTQAFNTDNLVNSDGTYSNNPSSTFLKNLKAVFITHLHQDHLMDYPSLLIIGSGAGLAVDPKEPKDPPIPLPVFGPPDRGQLEANLAGYVGAPYTTDSADPARRTQTPGTRLMTDIIFQAFAQANNDLTRDDGYRDFTALVRVTEIGGTAPGDIALPPFAPGTWVDPNTTPCPPIPPFHIYGPDSNHVSVSATLVNHHQVYPAFAFRFDTPDGSVVFSGDTGADTSNNLQLLANGADYLVHEVIDQNWIEAKFGPTPAPPFDALKTHMKTSHTQIDQVGTVARLCNVKTLVINHIVPGMAPMSHLVQAQANFPGRLIIGQDLMEIGLG